MWPRTLADSKALAGAFWVARCGFRKSLSVALVLTASHRGVSLHTPTNSFLPNAAPEFRTGVYPNARPHLPATPRYPPR